MKISDPLVVPTLPEEMMMMGANMPPELVSIFFLHFVFYFITNLTVLFICR